MGALYEKTNKPYFTQSFEWNWQCWQAIEPQGERLYCVIIRRRAGGAYLAVSHQPTLSFLLSCTLSGSGVLVDATQDGGALI
jgi:hypothetical protein